MKKETGFFENPGKFFKEKIKSWKKPIAYMAVGGIAILLVAGV